MDNKIIELIKDEKLIVIIRKVDREDLIPLCESLYDAGVRLVELTYSSDGREDEEIAKGISLLSEHFVGRLSVGAGTVVTERQVRMTRDAGGKFIISPNVSERVIKETKKAGLISIPGALTPSEIFDAYSYGADFVKVFPVGVMGSEYIRAIKAPLSNIPLLAVGGIDLNNMIEYFEAGVCGVGIGTSIVNKDLIKRKDFEAVRLLARRYVELVEAHRNKGE